MFAECICKIMASSQYVISLNTARHYFPGRCDSRWKKDELCHMVNRSNTLLVNTVLSCYETGKSYGGTSVLFTLKPEMLYVMQRRK
jgi:hypothetical protein